MLTAFFIFILLRRSCTACNLQVLDTILFHSQGTKPEVKATSNLAIVSSRHPTTSRIDQRGRSISLDSLSFNGIDLCAGYPKPGTGPRSGRAVLQQAAERRFSKRPRSLT